MSLFRAELFSFINDEIVFFGIQRAIFLEYFNNSIFFVAAADSPIKSRLIESNRFRSSALLCNRFENFRIQVYLQTKIQSAF